MKLSAGEFDGVLANDDFDKMSDDEEAWRSNMDSHVAALHASSAQDFTAKLQAARSRKTIENPYIGLFKPNFYTVDEQSVMGYSSRHSRAKVSDSPIAIYAAIAFLVSVKELSESRGILVEDLLGHARMEKWKRRVLSTSMTFGSGSVDSNPNSLDPNSQNPNPDVNSYLDSITSGTFEMLQLPDKGGLGFSRLLSMLYERLDVFLDPVTRTKARYMS